MDNSISLKEQAKYIQSKGWRTWYNPNYWVHEKTVEDSSKMDYTNYGMDLNSAYCFEKLKLPKFKFSIFALISMRQQGIKNMKQICKLLQKLEKVK